MHYAGDAVPAERSDRRIRRGHLRVRNAASRQRAEFSLTEALRMLRLAGEDEGRVYYFRRIELTDVPADGSRVIWQSRLQRLLDTMAARAVHGSDSRALSAHAVFFVSRQEALEILLRKILHRQALLEWFWPLVSGAAHDADRRAQILAIVEEQRRQPSSWSGVAQMVFAALGSADPATLLAALPHSDVSVWLRRLGSGDRNDASARAVPLAPNVADALRRASDAFGQSDPRTVWLATMAVALVAPAALENGAAVQRAYATLRQRSQLRAELPIRHGTLDADAIERHSFARPGTLDFDDSGRVDFGVISSPCDAPATGEVVDDAPFPSGALEALAASDRHIAGQTTAGAGLFFLLNAMTHLGIARTLHENRLLAESDFVPRLLQRLAVSAEVDPADALFRVLAATCSTDAALAARHPYDRALLRRWSLTVRRWCRRASGMNLPSIVQRHGRIALNRTDLDISLVLDDADIRIRRIGLDIDPAWLPWFGRVVRFHYTRSALEAPQW